MKLLLSSFLILFALLGNSQVKKELQKTTHKAVNYVYSEFNPRISMVSTFDTFKVELSKVADSIYSYKARGYININLRVDRNLKKATYDDDSFDSYFFDSEKERIESFKVKYVDNKIFEYEDHKYFVYRILVTNTKVEGYENLIFWCKEYGILMKKYLTNESLIRYEFANDEEKNRIVRHLCFFVFSESNLYNLKDWERIVKE